MVRLFEKLAPSDDLELFPRVNLQGLGAEVGPGWEAVGWGERGDFDVAVVDFKGGSAVRLEGDEAVEGDCGILFGIVAGWDFIDP